MESHERDGKTPLITAHDGAVCGVITVSDVIRKMKSGILENTYLVKEKTGA